MLHVFSGCCPLSQARTTVPSFSSQIESPNVPPFLPLFLCFLLSLFLSIPSTLLGWVVWSLFTTDKRGWRERGQRGKEDRKGSQVGREKECFSYTLCC
jgi:hypothetical protein